MPDSGVAFGVMTAHNLVSRRALIRDMGRAGMAVMILGMAACTSEEPVDDTTPTEEPDDSTTRAVPADSTTTRPEGSEPERSNPGHRWHRVDLGFVSAYILYRNGEATIVDTGVEGSTPAIESALSDVGLGWGDVGGLILTHRHPDHQGSVQGVLAATPAETPWYAGSGDMDAITAPYAGNAVADDDEINGLRVIESPGHTPGHISVLDDGAGILVSGDALNGADGGVAGPDPQFSEDMALANASVVKLAAFDYEVALFGHGEPVLDGASSAVADLATSLG